MGRNSDTLGAPRVTPTMWEQRRYEIAKDVLCAWYASGRTEGLEMDINDAVITADELIKRLKGGEQ